jgi:cell division transport system ATP-binding protein
LPLVYLHVSPEERIKRAKEALKSAGLEEERWHHLSNQLSGGQIQRVAIARALVNNPSLIMADEPTGNLDPETTDEIMKLLFQICKDSGTAIVMATHDYNVIYKYPARVIKTEGGCVIDNATLAS